MIMRMRGAARRLLWLLAAALGGGCGGGDIDYSQVAEGSVLNGRPTVLREGGEPVTGTVVKKNAAGVVIESVDYQNGFPTGWKRTWYDNGQLASEAQLTFRNYGNSSGLAPAGPSRSFCENGTLRDERLFDENSTPVGQHRTWTCNGELLTLVTHPSGEYRQASEYSDGTVRVTEEGNRTADGRWQGEHRRYHVDGSPALVEHWKDGVLDGPYQEWDPAGNLLAEGTYTDGQRTGLWRMVHNGWETVQDHDAGNFVDPDYAGPFMQAAGIQNPNTSWVAKLPLQDFRVDLEKLRYYADEGLVDVTRKLHLGPVPDPFVSSSWTYPYVRASSGALETLVALGADPRARDSDRRSRLHHCIFSLDDNGVCSPAEISRLIELGLAVDDPDIGDFTPLLDLVTISWNFRWTPSPPVQLEVAKILLDAGADPDRPGGRDTLFPQRNGMSPLMAAAHAKRYELAALLLERSRNPAATSGAGYNLIHLVFLDQNLQQFNLRLTDEARAFIQLAASKGVDPHAPLGELGTLKEVAQRAGAIDVAQFLGGLSS